LPGKPLDDERRQVLKAASFWGAASTAAIASGSLGAAETSPGAARAPGPVRVAEATRGNLNAADLRQAVSLDDYQELARRVLEDSEYSRIAGGAADEISLRWNRKAFENLRLQPEVMTGAVSRLDTRLKLFGSELAYPILIAPSGGHGFVHPEGEIATARGANAARAAMVLSTGTNFAVEEVAKATKQPLWFQLYLNPDRKFSLDNVQRAEAAGCKALCLTVDAPVAGVRNTAARSGHKPPLMTALPHLPNLASNHAAASLENITWKDLDWLASVAKIPVLVKGVLSGRDALRSLEHGAKGVIVSNHGARQLDTVPGTAEVLPEVVQALGGRAPILVDGGIRRGTDVLKALALGADAVLIGRSPLFGLAANGAEGVTAVMNILREELETAMVLTGRATLAELDSSVFYRGPLPV
jgi:4-hydroxymandelate oxidase